MVIEPSLKACLLRFFLCLASEFKSVQKEVSELLKGRVLIGHAIHHDLKVIDILYV